MLGTSPITYASRRQKITAQSTQEAEYIAAADLSNEVVWVQNITQEILEHMGIKEDIGQAKTKMLIDNNSARILANNPEHHRRAKHIEIRYHVLRVRVQKGEQVLDRVDSAENISDVFTKVFTKEKFLSLRDMLEMRMAADGS
ncbi:hypothetical protein HBI81_252870 [Parastagonospora nodorum]|nr:hypothetical protein HBI64_238210 [Parastagonospora nodorum]KAH6510824.1 hypothetical protein HBI81_252870 [Parastagonospora nodorum]